MSAGSAAPKPGPGSGAPLRTPKGMHDVLWPESARWEGTVARFASLVEGAGYGLTITPILEHAGVFLRGIGEASEVVGKEMYVFEDRDGQIDGAPPRGNSAHRPGVRAAPPGAALEGLVRGAVVPAREPPARPLPPAPPIGRGGTRTGRRRPRRRGRRPGPRLLRRLRPAPGDPAAEFHGRRGLPSGLRRTPERLPRRAGRPAVPRPPGPAPGEPAPGPRLQVGRVPGRHGGRPALPRPSVRPVPGPLRAGARRAGRARGALHHRPPSGAGLRLLHAHHLRVRGGRVGRGAERRRRGRTLRRPGGAARRRSDARHRVRHRDRAGAARLRCRGRVQHRVRWWRRTRCTPT